MTNETLRDKIAGIIWHDRQGQNTPESVADAILATIKASVPELVWMRNGNHWAGGHGYVIRNIGSQYTLTIRNQHGRQFDTLEAAQAEAQKHYAKQLTGWMDK